MRSAKDGPPSRACESAATGGLVEVEAGALPLLGPAGYHGAMVFFWVAGEDIDGSG